MNKNVKSFISKDDFILTLENQIPNKEAEIKNNFNVLSCMSDGKQILMLLKKHDLNKSACYIPITMENKLSWVSRVFDELVTTKKVVLVSENQPLSGLLG